MSDVVSQVGTALKDAFLMAWEVWWALVLGFFISAVVQAWVPRERIEANALVFDFELSDQDMAALDALDTADLLLDRGFAMGAVHPGNRVSERLRHSRPP